MRIGSAAAGVPAVIPVVMSTLVRVLPDGVEAAAGQAHDTEPTATASASAPTRGAAVVTESTEDPQATVSR
jgi:hypothetical protein